MCKNSLHFYDLYVVAEDDNLQILQNYEKLKKQKKHFESDFVLNLILSINIFLV